MKRYKLGNALFKEQDTIFYCELHNMTLWLNESNLIEMGATPIPDETECDYGDHNWIKVYGGKRCSKCKREVDETNQDETECDCVCHDPFPENGITFTHSIGQCKCQQSHPQEIGKIDLPGDDEWITETNGAWASEKMIKWAKQVTNTLSSLMEEKGE